MPPRGSPSLARWDQRDVARWFRFAQGGRSIACDS